MEAILRPVQPNRAWPDQIGIAFAFVFITSFAVFAAIKYTIGIRITERQEKDGLDISEHGMYGYPEHMADF